MREQQGGDLGQVDHAAAADGDDHVGRVLAAERDGGVDRAAWDVDDGVAEDRDLQAGLDERLAHGREPRRAGDRRVGADEHAAAVVGGDAAGGRGHPGAEQHLGWGAQDGEVGHRSVSRKVVTRRLNSSVRSSGLAWPQPPNTCARTSGRA